MLCKKYGISPEQYAFSHDDSGKPIDGKGRPKKFKLSKLKEHIHIGEAVQHPHEQGVEIRLDEFTVDFNNPSPAFVADFSVIGGVAPGRQTAMTYNGQAFPARVGNCYFYVSTYGPDTLAGTATIIIYDGTPAEYSVNIGKTVTLPSGARLTAMEATLDAKPFMAAYSGPAVHFEYSSPEGKAEDFLVFQEHQQIQQGPIEVVLKKYEQPFEYSIQTFCKENR